MRKILLILLLSFMLMGCSSRHTEIQGNEQSSNNTTQTTKEEKVYSFSNVGDKTSYQGISDYGIDYMFPKLSSKWDQWIIHDDDCRTSKNKENKSMVVIVRNNEVQDVTTDDFLKKLNGKDIRGYLEQQIATYVGKTEDTEGELNYVDQMKFYDVSGKTKLNNVDYIYKATYFQSRLFQPSVSRKYVPTAFFVLYEDGKDTESVLGMLETFKNNLIYQN